MNAHADVALADGLAVYRVARKSWRCTCADEVLCYEVYWERVQDWGTDCGCRGGPWGRTRVGAGQVAAQMRASDSYRLVEVRPRLNRNYPSRSPGCRGDIQPGQRYVEYLGDAAAYESGHRYCLPCGTAVWAASQWGMTAECTAGGVGGGVHTGDQEEL